MVRPLSVETLKAGSDGAELSREARRAVGSDTPVVFRPLSSLARGQARLFIPLANLDFSSGQTAPTRPVPLAMKASLKNLAPGFLNAGMSTHLRLRGSLTPLEEPGSVGSLGWSPSQLVTNLSSTWRGRAVHAIVSIEHTGYKP